MHLSTELREKLAYLVNFYHFKVGCLSIIALIIAT